MLDYLIACIILSVVLNVIVSFICQLPCSFQIVCKRLDDQWNQTIANVWLDIRYIQTIGKLLDVRNYRKDSNLFKKTEEILSDSGPLLIRHERSLLQAIEMT